MDADEDLDALDAVITSQMRQGMFEVADLPRLVEALAIGIEIDREFAAQCRVRNIPLNVAMTAPLLYMTHIPAPASANEWTQ